MEEIALLQGKRIVLGATGSVAVYKAVDVASKLTQTGALVDVVLTDAAQKFVLPLTFQSVTGRPVYTDMWQTGNATGGMPTHIAHVGLGESADLIAVIPATAQTLAELAQGMSDKLLTITALAARCPLLLAPAMDGAMYEHPATQANVQLLVERGAYLVEPDEGRFASGFHGKGRLPDTPTLIGHIRRLLGKQTGILSGKRVVVTAGGTREPIDPVRFIGNHSSGKQGLALAQAALDAGADVTLISTVEAALPGADVKPVDTAVQMRDTLLDTLAAQPADALIMAAAVADFRPKNRALQKIKKQDDGSVPTLELERNPDLLMTVKESGHRPAVCVGFAAESDNLLENARSKLQKKGLDFIVANDITATDAGFGSDYNRVVILDADGNHEIERMTKTAISEQVITRIAQLLG